MIYITSAFHWPDQGTRDRTYIWDTVVYPRIPVSDVASGEFFFIYNSVTSSFLSQISIFQQRIANSNVP